MLAVKVDMKGLLLGPMAPAKVRELAAGIINRLVEMGNERLAEVLRPRPAGVFLSVGEAGRGKASIGHYRRNLQSRVEGLTGIISDGGVIYGSWLEGTSSRNQTTRFKGYASFRKTRDWLDKQTPKVMEEHINRFVRDMN